MIKLNTFNTEDWKYIDKWITNKSELIQFAGQIFTFPIDKKQVEVYLSNPNRIVFKIEDDFNHPIGMAEINTEKKDVAKLARILIGEKSIRGKGLGTELVNKLTEYVFNHLQKNKVTLNVFSWNVSAIKCYKKAGFKRTNKPIKFITVKNEKWETIEMEKTSMEISVREMKLEDIEKVVNYFLSSDDKFIEGMGADKNKFPKKEEWVKNLKSELAKPYTEKRYYYIIWLLDNNPIGHSNVNNIIFSKSATIHLHLWEKQKRKSGLGTKFLNLTIPLYFKNLNLKKLICEPFSENLAPNKTLSKVGFNFFRTYETIPGPINFQQLVNRYELDRKDWKKIKY